MIGERAHARAHAFAAFGHGWQHAYGLIAARARPAYIIIITYTNRSVFAFNVYTCYLRANMRENILRTRVTVRVCACMCVCASAPGTQWP